MDEDEDSEQDEDFKARSSDGSTSGTGHHLAASRMFCPAICSCIVDSIAKLRSAAPIVLGSSHLAFFRYVLVCGVAQSLTPS